MLLQAFNDGLLVGGGFSHIVEILVIMQDFGKLGTRTKCDPPAAWQGVACCLLLVEPRGAPLFTRLDVEATLLSLAPNLGHFFGGRASRPTGCAKGKMPLLRWLRYSAAKVLRADSLTLVLPSVLWFDGS